MFTDFEQTIATFNEAFSRMDLLQALLFALFFLFVWFLPAIVAVFRNRQHLGKIFLANVPAIASWIAWFALLVWAATGRRKVDREAAMEPAEQ